MKLFKIIAALALAVSILAIVHSWTHQHNKISQENLEAVMFPESIPVSKR